ncbi:nuclear transport factor 2 family protein [Pseudoalteromonas neustonica]|uniref:Nuclear transport factor 2 family protein n=1 Tax=Pseudoalteromonas neustonica TaxID=1840331 RepID=A0ABU9U261_9GAMM
MNTNSTITLPYWLPLSSILNPQIKKQQALVGFDEEFVDIVDYILRITHRIWEQKNIGLCYRYYADICPVFTLGGYSENIEDVIQGTLKTIAAFPDRSLIGENVIFSQEENDHYYSSHLISSVMTNTGNSEFGPATNKTGRVTTIADCVCYKNQIVKEWLVRDNGFLVKQLGLNIIDVAKHMAKIPSTEKHMQWLEDEFFRVQAIEHRTSSTPILKGGHAAFAHNWLDTLFNQKQFSKIHEFYSLNATQQWPSGRMARGLAQMNGTFIQFFANCPDAKLTIDHLAITPFENDSDDIAIRWSLAGHFNPQSSELNKLKNLPYFLLGASHLRIKNEKIIEEVTVFDEIALYTNLFKTQLLHSQNQEVNA